MNRVVRFSRPFILLFFLLLLVSGCNGGQERDGADAARSPAPKATFSSSQGTEGAVLYLEVAHTPEERARGLMERKSLGNDRGMIFIFDEPTRESFWMKNTYIPLSVAFVAADGQIVDIQDMEPLTLNPHIPGKEYTYAIEANQGFYSANGIKTGDRVKLEGLD